MVHEFGEDDDVTGFLEDPVHPIVQDDDASLAVFAQHLQIVGCGKLRLEHDATLFQRIVHHGVKVRTRKVDDFVDPSTNLAVGVLKGDQFISLQQEVTNCGLFAGHRSAEKIVHSGSHEYETTIITDTATA